MLNSYYGIPTDIFILYSQQFRCSMRRSKLQIYVTILQTLADYGELISTHIIYNANLNCASSKEFLGFLIEHNLVQELKENKRKVYAITDSGLKVLQLVKRIDNSLHVFNEETYS